MRTLHHKQEKKKKKMIMRQREMLEFRTPQHPSLGTNHWGGSSPLLARNVPKESLDQKYLMLNSIRVRDEVFTYALPEPPAKSFQSLAQCISKNEGVGVHGRRRRGILSRLRFSRKEKVILGWNSRNKRWLPRLDPLNRWPQGW